MICGLPQIQKSIFIKIKDFNKNLSIIYDLWPTTNPKINFH